MTVHPGNPVEREGESLGFVASCIRLATQLRRAGQLEASENALRLALAYTPDHLEALIRMAHLLYGQGRHEEADAGVDRIIAFERDDILPQLNEELLLATIDLVELLRAQRHNTQADAVIEKIIALEPENRIMHRQFGMLLLRCGEFKHGWREWDKRIVPFRQPTWDGGPLAGKTILVQALHGFGDAIQFVRFLPLVKARGARVILEHQPALATLLQGADGWDTLVARHTEREVLEMDFDLHIPLMRLPAPLEIEDRIPATVPYLRPDPERVQRWRNRLAADQGCKVGLVWAGNPHFAGDRLRSCRLADYAWLARLPQVRFYSLQKGPATEQIASAGRKMGLTDLGPDLHDFADTAAAIMNLDLVISVDTAVAHLAGALGRPVWTLLPFHACWRWMEEREDTPWYPTMRLFRQCGRGDWANVLRRLIGELDAFGKRMKYEG
jgi:tetratricopeptide (TPR) repeat protein